MNYSTDGQFVPPEQNGVDGQNRNFGPAVPHFVSYEFWNSQKRCIKKLSTFAAVAILLFMFFSSVYSGIAQAVLKIASVSLTYFEYQQFAEKWNSSEFQAVFEIMYSVLIVGGPFFLVGRRAKKRGYLESIPMDKPLNTKFLPLIIVGAFGICLFGNVITSYFLAAIEIFFGIKLQTPAMPAVSPTFSGILMCYVSRAVVPALIEEMALRGIIMQPLRRYGDKFAIVCSSLIFGLMHCNLIQSPFAILAGFAIGYAVIVTESLWTGIIIHFLNNAFSVTVTIVTDLYGLDSKAYLFCNAFFISAMVIGGMCTFVYLKKFSKPLKKTSLVNQGKNFYALPHPYSARVSDKMLYKTFLYNAPMLIAFIAVVYETIVLTAALT